ncbi:MAG: transcription antitermination factor NusB [bacterium]
MSRRRARELTLQALYAYEMSGNTLENIIEDMILSCHEDKRIQDFAIQLLKHSVNNKKQSIQLIIQRTHNWDFERIAIIDKLIMRLAICEFLNFEDIPTKVTIDEAIEIAKGYSTEKSGQFINGILDGILIDLKKQDLIRKSVRGLQDKSNKEG